MRLPDEVKKDVLEMFQNLKDEVKLLVFTQKLECQYCEENRNIAEQVAGLSDKITIEIYDFEKDQNKAQKYKIDKIPAIAVVGKEDYGIRFYGIPAGYEFTSLIAAIKTVSTAEYQLSDEVKASLAKLDKEVHLQVFVTPTCPYCPSAVVLAHQMAKYSDKIRADMVEASEFPHLAVKYQVRGVPKTVINENESLEGAVPAEDIIAKINSLS